MRIDCHNHAMPLAAVRAVTSSPAFSVKLVGDRLWVPGYDGIELIEPFHDPSAKVAELETAELDGAVISVNPPLFLYEIDPAATAELCRATNSGLASFCAKEPTRLRWLAHLPMQSPDQAATMLTEAVAAGCVGVEVGTYIAGRRLDDQAFEPFWSQVDALKMPIFLHPGGNPTYPGLGDFFLRNLIGHLLETTLVVERLICAGTLTKYPNVQLLLAHGGGYFALQAGRLRHAASFRPDVPREAGDPWRHRGRLLVDSITHDSAALAYVSQRLGADNVVLGTDMPTVMADRYPINTIVGAVGQDMAHVISEETPARLFNWQEQQSVDHSAGSRA